MFCLSKQYGNSNLYSVFNFRVYNFRHLANRKICRFNREDITAHLSIFLQPAEAKDDFFASFSESPPPSQPSQQQAHAKDVDLLGAAMEGTQSAPAVSYCPLSLVLHLFLFLIPPSSHLSLSLTLTLTLSLTLTLTLTLTLSLSLSLSSLPPLKD